MTDQYIEGLVKYAARRGKKKSPKTKPPTREQFVALGMRTFGLTREQAERQYDDGIAADRERKEGR